MGTSNFARGNASRVFAVLMNEEREYKVCSECGFHHDKEEMNESHYENLTECFNGCDKPTFEIEFDTYAPDSFEIDSLKDYIREVADSKAPKDVRYSDEDGSDNNRNYQGTDLFSYRASKWYGDVEVEVQIVGKIVSAYYEGASLDYDVTVSDGYEFSDSDDAIEYAFGQSDMQRGMRIIQQRNAERWADRIKDQLIALTEQVFEEVSMPLKVVGTFSNGETIYEKL